MTIPSPPKILVTGSNGLLGQKIIYALVGRKNVTAIASSKGPNRLVLQSGYTYTSLDITNREEVNAVIEKFKPDVVINTAAMTNVDHCETRREECLALNTLSVGYIIEAMETYTPAAHLIHLSTDFVFDGEAGPYSEEDSPNPLSYYAQTKWESEKLVAKSKLHWAVARTIILYGIVDHMSRSNLFLWARDAMSKGQKINVVDDQFRSPTLAEDLALGCIAIADKQASGLFHLSGPETKSILDLVYQAADFWKLDKSLVVPIKSNTLNQAAKRPARTGFIIDKAKRELGYAPRTVAEGLAVLSSQLAEKAHS
jgi:dTDP-4-dehydrorhamnose reductase